MRPNEFKWSNLPPHVKDFLAWPNNPAVRAQVRLFLPPSSENLFSNLLGFLFLIFLTCVFAGGTLAFLKDKRVNWGGCIAMAILAMLMIWATIYAFGGMRVKTARFWKRKARFGYWVLESGIIARNSVRRIVYLPWQDISEITELSLYRSGINPSEYHICPALRVTLGGPQIQHYYFAGRNGELVRQTQLDHRRLMPDHYNLAGKEAGEFRMFKTACAEFKPVHTEA